MAVTFICRSHKGRFLIPDAATTGGWDTARLGERVPSTPFGENPLLPVTRSRHLLLGIMRGIWCLPIYVYAQAQALTGIYGVG